MGTINSIVKLFEIGFKHSSAQPFLILGGLLVVVSMLWAQDLFLFSVFTLFYALLNFKVETIRRSPDVGSFAVGTVAGATLYTILSVLLLFTWIAVSILLLIDLNSVLEILRNNHFLLSATGFVSTFVIVLFVIWTAYIVIGRLKGQPSQTANQAPRSQENLGVPRGILSILLLWFSIVAYVIAFSFFNGTGLPTLIFEYLLIFGSGLLGSAFRCFFVGLDMRPGKSAWDLVRAYGLIYPIIIGVLSFLILATFTHLQYVDWEFYASSMSVGFIVGALGLEALKHSVV